MRYKPYTDIESISPDFLEAVVADAGIPDNFVESAEGAIFGQPDPQTDPDARMFLGKLMTEIRRMGSDDNN